MMKATNVNVEKEKAWLKFVAQRDDYSKAQQKMSEDDTSN